MPNIAVLKRKERPKDVGMSGRVQAQQHWELMQGCWQKPGSVAKSAKQRSQKQPVQEGAEPEVGRTAVPLVVLATWVGGSRTASKIINPSKTRLNRSVNQAPRSGVGYILIVRVI
jgi:hypothetical protein